MFLTAHPVCDMQDSMSHTINFCTYEYLRYVNDIECLSDLDIDVWTISVDALVWNRMWTMNVDMW